MNARVSGHWLLMKGAPFDRLGSRLIYKGYYWATGGSGHGKCSCSVLSPELPSAAARKRWHREHKAEVS